MTMRARTVVAVVVALLLSIPAFAGDVGVALVSESDFDRWWSSGMLPVETSQHLSQCQDAKFNECSGCASLVVSNQSGAPIKVKTRLAGSAFSKSSEGGMFLFGGNRKGVLYLPCGGWIAPGGSCSTSFQFCPQQSGVSRGQ